MKIVMTTPRYYPHPGGTERVTQELAERMAARGHSVKVITLREPGVPNFEVKPNLDLEIIRLPFFQIDKFRFPRYYYRLIKSLDSDILHVFGQRVWNGDYLFPVLNRFPGVKVFTPHSYEQLIRAPNKLVNKIYYKYLPFVLKKFDVITAETEQEVMIDEMMFGLHPAFIPNGIDFKEFDTYSKGFLQHLPGPKVLYVGGFRPKRRVDELIRALAKTRERYHLIVVGEDTDGTAEDRKLEAELYGVDMHYIGKVTREELISLYLETDVVALPSEEDNLPVTLLEANAAEKWFVSTDIGGAEELSLQGAGFVANFDQFAGAIDSAYHQTNPPNRISEIYEWDNIITDLLRLYTYMLCKKKNEYAIPFAAGPEAL